MAMVPVLNIMAGRLKGVIFIHDMNVSFGDRLVSAFVIENSTLAKSKASTLAKLIVNALIIIDSSLTQSVIILLMSY